MYVTHAVACFWDSNVFVGGIPCTSVNFDVDDDEFEARVETLDSFSWGKVGEDIPDSLSPSPPLCLILIA